MLGIVDYGRGNLFSITQALTHLGVEHALVSSVDMVAGCDRLILPGVGAFSDAMQGLRRTGLHGAVRNAIDARVPLLGICVGCQLLLEQGEEFGVHAGLGVIPGTVRRLRPPAENDKHRLRLPNIGWRHVKPTTQNGCLADVDADGRDTFYFVHSYAPFPREAEAIAAVTQINGERVPVAVRRDRVYGVQFHPEKSGDAGLRLLHRFATTMNW